MSYSNVTCGILSPLNISSKEIAIRIFELLERHPSIRPTHIGNTEPLREKYQGPQESISKWGDPVLWKNVGAKGKCTGSVWFGTGSQHSSLFVHITPARAEQDVLKRFLLDAFEVLTADFGYMHLTNEAELDSGDFAYETAYALDVGLTTRDLVKGIPNLAWATIFGGPYKKAIERLGCLDNASIVERKKEAAWLQLTPSMNDVVSDYAQFELKRQEAKRQIGLEFFLSPDRQRADWTPTFKIEPRQQLKIA